MDLLTTRGSINMVLLSLSCSGEAFLLLRLKSVLDGGDGVLDFCFTAGYSKFWLLLELLTGKFPYCKMDLGL